MSAETKKAASGSQLSPVKKFLYFFSGDTRGRTHYKDPVSAYQARPKMWIVNLVSFLVFLAVLVYMNINLNVSSVFTQQVHWDLAKERLHDFFTPDWDYYLGKGDYAFSEGVLYSCFVTLGITIVGTSFAFLLSIPFGFLASHKLFGRYAYIEETILIVIRTFPELLLALFFVSLTGQTWMTALLCLSIHSIGMIGKLFADQLDEMDTEGLEAMDAQGANPFQRVALAVFPEVRPAFFSVGLYRLDINLRSATTIGIVLSQDAGIGFSILMDLSKNAYHRLGADTFGILLMIIVVDLFSSWLRKKLV